MSRKANAQMDFFYEKIVDNYPEWCKHPVTTMAELESQVAV